MTSSKSLQSDEKNLQNEIGTRLEQVGQTFSKESAQEYYIVRSLIIWNLKVTIIH